MKMNVNPLSGKRIDNRRRLVFDEQTVSYISLAKGEEGQNVDSKKYLSSYNNRIQLDGFR